jgi:ribokinase
MVVRLPRIPEAGETVLGGSFLRADGGKGANQAVAAARLGAEVTFVGRVGADELGERAVAGLRDEGIDVSHVSRDEKEPSGVALIFVDERGENAIAVAPGANAALSEDDVERAGGAIETADVLLLQLETPLPTVERAAAVAAAAGVTVILNPAPAQPLPDSLLYRVDVLTPNEGEARLLAALPGDDATREATAGRLLERGVRRIVVTLGAAGALVITRAGEEQLVEGFSVDAVDTTAAGDAFSGALAVALAEGPSLAEAVRFACAAGAVAATARGARPSLPRRERLELLLASGR